MFKSLSLFGKDSSAIIGVDWLQLYCKINFDFMEKNDDEDLCYIDDLNDSLKDEDKIKFEELKEYVGEGICYDGSYGDDYYNVEFKGDIMEISFIFKEE
jgi:hypothetical protein